MHRSTPRFKSIDLAEGVEINVLHSDGRTDRHTPDDSYKAINWSLEPDELKSENSRAILAILLQHDTLDCGTVDGQIEACTHTTV